MPRFVPPTRAAVVGESMALNPRTARAAAARKEGPEQQAACARAAQHHAALTTIASADGTDGVVGADGSPLFFPPVPRPRPGDWLAENQELGQSFVKYAKQTGYSVAQPHGPFDTIAIVLLMPVGDTDVPQLPAKLPRELKDYIEAFYAPLRVEVVSQPVLVVSGPKDEPKGLRTKDTVRVPYIGSANGVMGVPQVAFGELLRHATAAVSKRPDLRRRVVMTMGLTTLDITLDNGHNNWVYGAARPTDSAGVFSLVRFRPEFAGEDPQSSSADETMRRRAFKVVSHELGHLFGLRHCTDLLCLMNGANHVDELNRQPLLECPACTLKLSYTLPWSDLPTRYRRLAEQLARHELRRECDMVNHRILPALTGARGADPAAAVPRADAAP